jgi:hypothetical protein
MSQPTKPDAGRQAREQAQAYNSIFAISPLKLDDGTTIEVPPHPDLELWDEEALAALQKLNYECESYDRHPDMYFPGDTFTDKAGNQITVPGEIRKGLLKENPRRKTDPQTGEVTILDPPYKVQVVQIALGPEGYARLRAGTINGRRGCAADVWRHWAGRGVDLADRADADPKSVGSTGVLAAVAAPDSK